MPFAVIIFLQFHLLVQEGKLMAEVRLMADGGRRAPLSAHR